MHSENLIDHNISRSSESVQTEHEKCNQDAQVIQTYFIIVVSTHCYYQVTADSSFFHYNSTEGSEIKLTTVCFISILFSKRGQVISRTI